MFHRLARLDEITEGFRRVVRLPIGPVLLIEVDGELVVIEDQCPHQGFPIHKGSVTNRKIRCPRHGFHFHLDTGECSEAPGCTLRRFDVAYDGQWVGLDLETD